MKRGSTTAPGQYYGEYPRTPSSVLLRTGYNFIDEYDATSIWYPYPSSETYCQTRYGYGTEYGLLRHDKQRKMDDAIRVVLLWSMEPLEPLAAAPRVRILPTRRLISRLNQIRTYGQFPIINWDETRRRFDSGSSTSKSREQREGCLCATEYLTNQDALAFSLFRSCQADEYHGQWARELQSQYPVPSTHHLADRTSSSVINFINTASFLFWTDRHWLSLPSDPGDLGFTFKFSGHQISSRQLLPSHISPMTIKGVA